MDAFVSSIEKEDYERKFNGKMQKSVKKLEMDHHRKTMVKKGHRPLFEIPDYLKHYQEPPKMSDLQDITKAILEDTFDEHAEDLWLNKIIYQHLPSHQKLIFRSKYLKDVPLEELGVKPKRKLQKTRK